LDADHLLYHNNKADVEQAPFQLQRGSRWVGAASSPAEMILQYKYFGTRRCCGRWWWWIFAAAATTLLIHLVVVVVVCLRPGAMSQAKGLSVT